MEMSENRLVVKIKCCTAMDIVVFVVSESGLSILIPIANILLFYLVEANLGCNVNNKLDLVSPACFIRSI